jgi:hypothetical protein
VRGFVFLLAGLLVTSLIGGARNPNDCASVKENGDEVTFRAETWDPVLTIGRTLADRYGINVSVEAPKWAFPAIPKTMLLRTQRLATDVQDGVVYEKDFGLSTLAMSL